MATQEIVVCNDIIKSLLEENAKNQGEIITFLYNIKSCCKNKIVRNKEIDEYLKIIEEKVQTSILKTLYSKWFKEMMKNHKIINQNPNINLKLEVPQDNLICYQTSLNTCSKIYVTEKEDLLKNRENIYNDYGIKTLSISEANEKVIKFQLKNDWSEIISEGESQKTEFKSSIRWDYNENKPNKALLEPIIAKEICGFLNTSGGKIFIGVKDDGEVLGLEKDYNTLGKKNKDGFLLTLDNVIQNKIGNHIFSKLKIEIGTIEEKEICCIRIKRSKQPIYYNNTDFYIRRGASTIQLTTKDTIDYINNHFN